MKTPLFVYGTLKRGGMNHRYLQRETFVAEAKLAPGFRLYDVGGYPGLVPDANATYPISGELWEVSDAGLAELDRFEGVPEGLYRREAVQLEGAHKGVAAQCYIYARSVAGLQDLGDAWRE